MPPELRGGVFVQLPLGYAAGRANALEPLVAQPSRGPAVAGVVDQKCLVAMGGDSGLPANNVDHPDAM